MLILTATLIQVAALLVVVIVALAVGFIIPTILELRRTAEQATLFLKNTEANVNATLTELEATLRSVRAITDHVEGITADVNNLSSAVSGAAEDIKQSTRNLERATRRTAGNFSGLRAGLHTALQVFMNNLSSRRGGRS